MKLIWVLILATLVSACASKGPTNQERAELYYRVGTGYLTAGNYPAALRELLRAVELDPDNPDIQNNLGLAYLVRNKYSKAEKHIRAAVETKPQFTEARNNLARILIEQRRYTEAIGQLQQCIQDLTYPFPEKSHSNLGLAYFRTKNYKMAAKHFKMSISLRSKSCATRNGYGRSLFELKDYTAAAQALDQAIDVCKTKKLDEPHYYSALAYYNLGQREQAIARFEEIIALYPQGQYSVKSKEMLKIIK
jgi:type IV pilus assembly protein PilF